MLKLRARITSLKDLIEIISVSYSQTVLPWLLSCVLPVTVVQILRTTQRDVSRNKIEGMCPHVLTNINYANINDKVVFLFF